MQNPFKYLTLLLFLLVSCGDSNKQTTNQQSTVSAVFECNLYAEKLCKKRCYGKPQVEGCLERCEILHCPY
jgi:hypothetical protein